MCQLKIVKVKRLSLIIVSVMILLLLYGCEGGIVGTGTGPSAPSYELKNLPERISPDIPKTTSEDKSTNPATPKKTDNTETSDNLSQNTREDLPERAEGWLVLNSELFFVKNKRRNTQNNVTLIDLAFDDILSECAQQSINCKIPDGKLRVTMTQKVVNRFIKQHNSWAESVSFGDEAYKNRLLQDIRNKFTSLLDSEVVLGETTYSRLDGSPYDHTVHTYFKRGPNDDNLKPHTEEMFAAPWFDEEVIAHWREDGTVAKFVIDAADPDYEFQSFTEYFYQNGAPGELVTAQSVYYDSGDFAGDSYVTVFGDDPDNAGILVEVMSSDYSYSWTNPDIDLLDPGDDMDPSSEPPVPTEPDDPPELTEEELEGLDDLPYTKHHHYNFLRGRTDKEGGYTIFNTRIQDLGIVERLILDIGTNADYRESFDSVGTLLAGERCIIDVTLGNDSCNEDNFETFGPEGSLLSDSVHYFKPEDFDSLTSIQDAVRWQVQGLPVGLTYIGVVSADQTTELSERTLLCRGVQFTGEDVRIFCTATDEQIVNSVVVELSEGKPSRIIQEASVVQIP